MSAERHPPPAHEPVKAPPTDPVPPELPPFEPPPGEPREPEGAERPLERADHLRALAQLDYRGEPGAVLAAETRQNAGPFGPRDFVQHRKR